jgi:hypothetical protein
VRNLSPGAQQNVHFDEASRSSRRGDPKVCNALEIDPTRRSAGSQTCRDRSQARRSISRAQDLVGGRPGGQPHLGERAEPSRLGVNGSPLLRLKTPEASAKLPAAAR